MEHADQDDMQIDNNALEYDDEEDEDELDERDMDKGEGMDEDEVRRLGWMKEAM